MKLFDWFKKKNRAAEESEEPEEQFPAQEEKEEIKITLKPERFQMLDKEQRNQYIKDCCDQMLEASKEMENTKIEYDLITSYLNDMQEIENLALDEKAEFVDTARKIVQLNNERKVFQTNTNRITDSQFWMMESKEDEIPDALERMLENESYQNTIKSDMQHLEGEKGVLKFRRKELYQELQNLKGLSMISFSTIIVVILIILAFELIFEADIKIAYFTALFAAALVSAGIFIKIRSNLYEMKLTEKMLNRAIYLLNKAKVKYVNVTNALEYTYSVYGVNSAHQFNHIWEEYIKEKEEKNRYQRTTDDIEFYNSKLIRELRQFKINDPTVWPHQAIALIDNKEMVEIRHRLVVRRQKIRAQMEYNNKIMQDTKKEISDITFKYPEYAREILEVVNSADSPQETDKL